MTYEADDGAPYTFTGTWANGKRRGGQLHRDPTWGKGYHEILPFERARYTAVRPHPRLRLGWFTGEVNEAQQRHGAGVFEYENGDRYEGAWAQERIPLPNPPV